MTTKIIKIDGKNYEYSNMYDSLVEQLASNPSDPKALDKLLSTPKYQCVKTLIKTLPNGLQFFYYLDTCDKIMYATLIPSITKFCIGKVEHVSNVEYL